MPPWVGSGGHAQLQVDRGELAEADLAVLRLAALGDVEVAHDLDAGDERVAVACRDLDVGHQRAVLAEADLGLLLARAGLDVDVGGALTIGVDDDLVDQLDELVVGGGVDLVPEREGVLLVIVETGQQVRDRGVVQGHTEELLDRQLEVALGGDAVGQPLLRQHVLRHARAAHLLGVDAQDHHALGVLLPGQPQAALDELALDVAQQVHRLDVVGDEGLIGHAEIARGRCAEFGVAEAELLDQQVLGARPALARLAGGVGELLGGDTAIDHQRLEARTQAPGLAVVAQEGDAERLCEPHQPLLGHLGEGFAVERVDELHDPEQAAGVGIADGRDQHLARVEAGAGVDLAAQREVRRDAAQLLVVVHVADIDQLAAERDEAGDAVLADRQADALHPAQPGLDPGDDRGPALLQRVDGEALGLEQRAQLGRELEHDLVGVLARMDAVGQRLQALEEGETVRDGAGHGGVHEDSSGWRRPGASGGMQGSGFRAAPGTRIRTPGGRRDRVRAAVVRARRPRAGR
jgi:hypothetical protein